MDGLFPALAQVSAPISFLALLALGFFLGMRHATDPDHVIAVSTIVSRERSVRHSLLIGALWGLGHTLTVFGVGVAIVLFNAVISPRLGLALELSVGLMLILLGLMNLNAFRRSVDDLTPGDLTHSHYHTHGDYIHDHRHGHAPGTHSHDPAKTPVSFLDRMLGRLTIYQACRPLVIGIVHGLAGSAAVALLVLATIRDPRWAVAYLLVFGVGTIAGMMVITVALGSTLAYTQNRSRWIGRRLGAVAGVVSVAFGLFITYQITVVNGLFGSSPQWTPH